MSLPRRKLTPQEYLDIERRAEHKSEFHDGEMFSMASAGELHEAVKMNIATALITQLRGRGCRVFTSDMRVKVSATGLYTYPDVVAVCGERLFEDAHVDTLLNPSVVVEVLSPTTEGYDRGKKFAHYRRVDAITDYVLVAPDRMSVEHYTRASDGTWSLHAYEQPDDAVVLNGLGARLPLSDIYLEIQFPPNSALRAVPPGASDSDVKTA